MKMYGRIKGVFYVCPIKYNKPTELPGATSYYARGTNPHNGKPKNFPLGADFQQAYVEFLNMEKAVATGEPAAVMSQAAPETIATKIDAYLNEFQSEWAPSSYRVYKKALADFRQSCIKTNVGDITVNDLNAFKTFLRTERKASDRTVVNKFENVMQFLKWAKIHLDGVKWPEYVEREVEAYTDQEIELFRSTAKNDAALMIDCFLFSGLRDQELAHLTYGDVIAPSHFRVKSTANWKTKTATSNRVVPVPPELCEAIKARQEIHGRLKSDLIFMNRNRGPEQHFIRETQRIAKEAGITGRVDNHKFRATAITLWLRDGRTIQDVMAWVGHTNPTIVMRYAAKLRVMSEETVALASKAFQKFLTPQLVEDRRKAS